MELSCVVHGTHVIVAPCDGRVAWLSVRCALPGRGRLCEHLGRATPAVGAILADMSDVTGAADGDRRCPCTSGLTFGECCGPILSGARRAPTAEALMRSRFSAFAIGDRDHILDSWHPRTRPRRLVVDDGIQWYRLDVESASGGTPFDNTGEVTFTAHYRANGERKALHQRSRFERRDGRWVYLDGTVEG
jgi:SEC-C motif-containing protein